MAMSNEKNDPKQSKPSGGDQFNPAKPAPALAGQTVVEAPEPPPQSLQSQWEEKAEAYVLSRGWEKVGLNARGKPMFLDPQSHPKAKSELVPNVTLPAVGGGTEVVMQWKTPPATWPCVLEQAYFIQTSRDRAGESLDTVIARKEEELEALKTRAAVEKKDGKKVKVA